MTWRHESTNSWTKKKYMVSIETPTCDTFSSLHKTFGCVKIQSGINKLSIELIKELKTNPSLTSKAKNPLESYVKYPPKMYLFSSYLECIGGGCGGQGRGSHRNRCSSWGRHMVVLRSSSVVAIAARWIEVDIFRTVWADGRDSRRVLKWLQYWRDENHFQSLL